MAAKRFWQQHEADLNPGAVLNVTLEAARTHTLHTRPPTAEMQARVVSMELVPKTQATA